MSNAPSPSGPLVNEPKTAESSTSVPESSSTVSEPDDGNGQGCWLVSVLKDATYCIQGPTCSGSGDKPFGVNCPVHGDTAVADCRSYLNSSSETDEECELRENATCQRINTGAWACVLPSTYGTPLNGSNQSSSTDILFPNENESLQLYAYASGSGSSTSAIIGSVGAVVAVGCAIAGTILHKRSRMRSEDVARDEVVMP